MSSLSKSAQRIDNEDAESMAREAYASRPRESSMWDGRLYQTHAPIMVRAINADDILSDSNYESALEHLVAVATVWQQNEDGDARECLDDRPDVFSDEMREQSVECECEDCSPSVIDARISDWLAGPIDQLFVRTHWADGTIANVWREACSLIDALRDYPVLNDSDFSDREYEAYSRDLEDALAEAIRSHEHADLDSDADADAIKALFYERMDDTGDYLHGNEYSTADWDGVAEHYGNMRNAYYEYRSQAALYAGIGTPTQVEGQQSFPWSDGSQLSLTDVDS